MLRQVFEVYDYEHTYQVYVKFTHYIDPKNIALQLFDINDHSPYGIPTVNLENFSGKDKHRIALDVNNYPNCERYLKAAGYIEAEPLGYLRSGYVNYPIYQLTLEAIQKYQADIAQEEIDD